MAEVENESGMVPQQPATVLDRRAFLGAAGGVALGAALAHPVLAQTPGAAGTPATAAYPSFPALAEKPLPPALLATTGISRRTHEEHYKLYQGYVRKSNEIMAKLAAATRDPAAANQTFSEIRELKVELTFALGGVKNHELYFEILGGRSGTPGAALAREINRAFGSVAAWRADLKATGLAGRGWAWTAWDHDLGRLMNYIGDAQNTYPVWNAVPIIGLDVYEHAYYLDFGTRRGDYIDAFFENLNWTAVEARLRGISISRTAG